MFTVLYGLRQWKKNKLQTLVLLIGLSLFTACAINLLSTAPKLFSDREPWMSSDGRYATIGLESHNGQFNPIDERKLERYRNSPAVEKFMTIVNRHGVAMEDSKGNSLKDANLIYLSDEFLDHFQSRLPLIVSELNESGVLISYEYWQSFNQLPLDEITFYFPLNDTTLPVIGVLPKDFTLFDGKKMDVLLTERQMDMTFGIQFGEHKPSPEQVKMILKELISTSAIRYGIVKLKPGYAPADVTSVEQQESWEEGNSHKMVLLSDNISFSPAVELGIQFSPQRRKQLLKQWWMILGLTIGFLLLSLFNLLTSNFSRYLQRQQEFQTRQAVGATTQDLMKQLLVENMLLGILTSLLGSVISLLLWDLIKGQFDGVAELSATMIWFSVAIFAILTTLITTFIGLVPFVLLNRKVGFSRSKNRGQSVTQQAINSANMVVQIGFSVLAITCAVSLWLTQQKSIEQVPVRSDLQHLIYKTKQLNPNKMLDIEEFKVKLSNQDFTIGYSEERLIDSNYYGTLVSLEDPNIPSAVQMQIMPISDNFLSFIGAEHIAGEHNPSDVNQVVVNYSAATALGFKNPQEAIGQQIFVKNLTSYQFANGKPIIIIGVVVDLPHSSLIQSRQAMVYNLLRIQKFNQLQLYVAAKDKQALKNWLAREAISAAQDIDIVDAGGIREQLREQNSDWFFLSKVVLSLAVLVCTLSATSLYQQLVGYLIEHSNRYAVMQALGAQLSDVVLSISKALAPKVLLGLVLGAITVVLFNGWFQQEFYSNLLNAKHLTLSGGILLMLLLISYLPEILLQLSRPIQKILNDG